MPIERVRVPSLDFMRGVAVFGFMLWHAFDIFYSGNKYDVPLFRSTILTRISFVMVSGLVLGLKDWSSYRLNEHLKRSLKLMGVTFIVALCYALSQGSMFPIYRPFVYILGGPSDFTFSILISLGCIYLFIPLILKYFRLNWLYAILIAAFIIITDCLRWHLPEIYRFFLIALFFAYFMKSKLCTNNNAKFCFSVGFILFLSVITCVILQKNIYWYIRNTFSYQLIFLFLFCYASIFLYTFDRVKNSFVVSLVETFGSNSLFVYIFHYALYLITLYITDFSTNSSVAIMYIWIMAILIFAFLLKNEFLCNKFRIVFG